MLNPPTPKTMKGPNIFSKLGHIQLDHDSKQLWSLQLNRSARVSEQLWTNIPIYPLTDPHTDARLHKNWRRAGNSPSQLTRGSNYDRDLTVLDTALGVQCLLHVSRGFLKISLTTWHNWWLNVKVDADRISQTFVFVWDLVLVGENGLRSTLNPISFFCLGYFVSGR